MNVWGKSRQTPAVDYVEEEKQELLFSSPTGSWQWVHEIFEHSMRLYLMERLFCRRDVCHSLERVEFPWRVSRTTSRELLRDNAQLRHQWYSIFSFIHFLKLGFSSHFSVHVIVVLSKTVIVGRQVAPT